MSCKSAIYMANTVATNVAANSAVPFGTIQRRYGRCVNGTSAGITLNEPGYYLVTANISYTAETTGNAVVSLQQDGANVPGATASDTVATATTEINNMTITGIIRVLRGNAPDVITIQNTGIAITTENVAISAVKL